MDLSERLSVFEDQWDGDLPKGGGLRQIRKKHLEVRLRSRLVEFVAEGRERKGALETQEDGKKSGEGTLRLLLIRETFVPRTGPAPTVEKGAGGNSLTGGEL